MNKTLLAWLKNKYVIIGIVLVALIIAFFIYRHSQKAAPFETATATVGNVVESVSVTGTVSPVSEADLAFEKGGILSRIYVSVGQAVSSGQSIASLDSAGDIANLAAAQASLDEAARPLRPEEQSVEQVKIQAAEIALSNAVQDSYTKTKNAVGTYTNNFFTNPESVLPTFNLPTDSDSIKQNLENERFQVNLSLTNWAGDLAASNNSVPVQTLVTKSNTYIASTKKFFADLALIVNKLAPNNSGLSQATINNDIDSINSGLAVLNQAETSLSTAQIDLTTTKSNYSLRQAGNSSETIAGAQAKVDLARAELAKDTILSPLDGVVARIDPQLGEFVTAGKGSFSVISNQAYKIEAFVPEADIAKVKIGDPATTTLDAYGSDTYFASKVTMIDPAQTVLEGVPTYKVTLYFNSADNRIRSGMTANLDIHTNERDGVLNVPYRAIISNDGHKTIRIVNPDGKTYQEVPITTGLRGSDGTIEITSGLKAGQKVVTYLKP